MTSLEAMDITFEFFERITSYDLYALQEPKGTYLVQAHESRREHVA